MIFFLVVKKTIFVQNLTPLSASINVEATNFKPLEIDEDENIVDEMLRKFKIKNTSKNFIKILINFPGNPKVYQSFCKL